ncbi:MAG: homogentisate 1,2-dioxygenase [Myxococcales bacterium]|nr:homogentisate 1,2-dioxygenase [Myxococcales bacterium]
MRSWIHHSKGQVPKQAHVAIPKGLKEDEIGRKGFQGRIAELYRLHEPTAWVRVEGDHKPWDLDGAQLAPKDLTDPRGDPVQVFYNDDLSIEVSRRAEPMPYWYRNCDADDLFFVHRGTGHFETEFGPLDYEPGDYIVLPKGVTYRVVPDGRDNYFLLIRATAEIEFPDYGGLGRHAPFDPALIEIPDPKAYEGNGAREYEVRCKLGGTFTSFFYNHHPMDVVGWKGDLFPFRFNMRDYRPIFSDHQHLPPSAHMIFQGKGFVVVNFLPRPAERQRDVERLPWYHRNPDYDEVGFVHAGSLMGAAMEPATFMMHPQGIHHGLGEDFRKMMDEQWQEIVYLDWKIVNIDTEKVLKLSPEARAVERQ